MENRGCRAETNQHEELEMCAEMSELISQTPNYTLALATHKEYWVHDLRGYKRNCLRLVTFYQQSYNLTGEERCQHLRLA